MGSLGTSESGSHTRNGTHTNRNPENGTTNVTSTEQWKASISIEGCIHHAFEARAREDPQAPAIDAWDGNLRYGELDVLASTLANHLIKLGAGPEIIIGLMFDKSVWAVVAMVAVLKAGSACVNLAPNQPRRRLEVILRKSKPIMILTATTYESLGRALHPKTLSVNSQSLSKMPQKTTISSPVSSRNPAYILFTSGSTGEPKGIVVEHGSLRSSSAAHGQQWHIEPGTRVFQFAAFTFDVSVADIFTSLSRGACICVPSEKERVEDLAGAIRRSKANWAFLTPSVASTISAAAVPELETLVIGGEPATKQLLIDWAVHVELIVCYGPAECSIYCTGTARVRADQDPLNIGFPIGCKIFIANPNNHHELMPAGYTGEIIVQSRIVARGYLNEAPGIDAPFLDAVPWSEGHDRLYKTGDLGRINPDGSINIEGRKDTQVKIRGQRVELGEIEHHLKNNFVSSKRIIVHTPASSERFRSPHNLVAFVVVSEFNSMSEISGIWAEQAKNARNSLHATLPSYMIPTLFVPLNTAPLTSNGKIDRARLQAIYEQYIRSRSPETVDTSSEALTTEEALLHQLWSSILHVPLYTIQSNDNFLHLGGDSIKAMLLISEVREAGFDLSFQAALSSSDLSAMAREIVPTSPTDAISIPKPFSLMPFFSDNEAVKSNCATLCNITPEFVADIYPATPLQEGLMTLSQQEHDQYVSRYVFNIPLETCVEKLCSAWDDAYQSLEILRTRLVYLSGAQRTLQVVVNEQIEWMASESLDDPLGLGGETTYGKRLSRLAFSEAIVAGKSQIVWSIHHALIDAISVEHIFNFVTARYRQSAIPSLIPFKSFVAHVSSLEEQRSCNWWKEYLEDISAPNWPSATKSAKNIETITHSFLVDSLRSRDFTVATCLRAAWAFLISTYSGSNDVVFGSTNSGRSLPMLGILAVAGPTIVTVPFRVVFGKAQTLRELLQAVQQNASAMSSHEHLGLQRIRRLDVNTESASFFGSLLIVQPRRETSALGEISPLVVASDPVVGSYPLTLECKETTDGVEMVLNFQSESVSEAKAARILRQMEEFALRFMSPSANSPVFGNQIHIPDSFGYSCHEALKVQDTLQTCVHNEFRSMVARQPSASAVEGWDAKWTYELLDELSTRAAYALKEIGVKAGDIVPICAKKSSWVIVSILAVLKVGAAFLPLDNANPPERLKRIVQRVKANIVITNDHNTGTFIETVPQVLPITKICPEKPNSATYTLPHPDPSSLAYIIFTSGSTGEPKGVEVEHRAFCTGALSRAPHIHRDYSSRVFQFSSYGFDTSIEDILTTLITGGCVCVPSEQDRRDNFAKAFTKLGANCADITPSLAHVLSPQDLPTLKTLILGGELMSASLVKKWASDKVTLINTYGPTECAIVASVTEPLSVANNENSIGTMPCGQPWIVDPSNHNRLLPKGAIGELLVEGPFLARGYYKDEKQTRQAFVAGLSWARSEQLFYKTGDLAILDEVESLVFVGRKDSQVKIRGQRVELAEVESHVRAASGIESVVVELLTIAHQEQALIAFLAVESSDIEAEFVRMTDHLQRKFQDCQERLRAAVPSYMIPSIIIPITSIPLTRSGKVDKRAMIHMVQSLSREELLQFRLADRKRSSPLADNSHKLLGELWAEILGVDLSYVYTDLEFFRAGGDSLSAVRLSASAQDAGLQLSVSDIFRHPKLCDMALHLKARAAVNDLATVQPEPFSLLPDDFSIEELLRKQYVSFGKDDVEDLYPATPTQEALMALSAKQPSAYIARFSDYIKENVDMERLRGAWEHVVRHFPILRTRILVCSESGTVQAVLRPNKATESSFSKQPPRTMNYGDPLFHIRFDRTLDKRIVHLTIHHALFDAESLEIIQKGVEHFYHGNTSALQHVSIPRYILSLRKQDEERERTYWHRELDGTPSTAFCMADRINNGERREQVTTHTIPIDENLRICISSSKHTTALLLRAAWALTIATFTNADDVLFGVTLSGRNKEYEGIRNLAVPTMTTVPLRVRVNKSESTSSFLEELTNQATGMIPFEHTGLHKIQQYLGRRLGITNILVVQYSPGDAASEKILLSGPVEGMEASTSYYTEDLVLECTVSTTQIELRTYFDARNVHREQLAHQIASFAHLFKQLISMEATTSLSKLQPCNPDGFSQIAHWNAQTRSQAGKYISVHESVRKMAFADPSATALVSWEGTMTFGELEHHTENLARHISSFSYGGIEGTVVPVFFGKSMYAIVAMLAIMKAGGAYAALDAANPAQRLQEMVGMVRTHMCLASPELGPTLESAVDEILVVDHTLLSSLSSQAVNRDTRGFAGEDISPWKAAIVVFTSGSTGSPKPIVLSHKAVTSCAKAYGPGMGFGRGSRVLSNAAYAFDIHACEIFLTLIHGGILFLTNRDRSNLVEVVNDWNINWLFSTPSALQFLPGPEAIPSVKTLMMIGEAPSRNVYAKWVREGLHLINAYGPAENTLFSTMAPIESANQDPAMIGRAYNTAAWIVDPDDQERIYPVGAVGELVLQGEQLSDGYLHEPFKTDAVFIQAPPWMHELSEALRTTCYKTGDLCQFNHDGTLRILGRTDSQVKIRGQRLETADVEYHLRKFIDAELAVDCLTFASGRQSLAAFVVVKDSNDQSGSNLITSVTKEFMELCGHATTALVGILPLFMIPTLFIPISSMPRTASDKLDRKLLRTTILQLPEKDSLAFVIQDTESLTHPNSDAEHILQRLWAKVLNVDQNKIGKETSFEALGGDSIAAIRLAVAVRSSDDKKTLAVVDILRFPRLSQMALHIKIKAPSAVDPDLVTFALLSPPELTSLKRTVKEQYAVNVIDAYPCTPLQEGFMRATVQDGHAYISHQVFAIEPNTELKQLRSAWHTVLVRYEVLRTIIVTTASGDVVQAVLPLMADLQLVDVSSLLQYLGDSDAHGIQNGSPLFKVAFVRGAENKVVVTAHHSVFDAWFFSRLLSEVESLYHNRKSTLPELIPFAHFVQHVRNTQLEPSRLFWEEKLQGETTSQVFSASDGAQQPRQERSVSHKLGLWDNGSPSYPVGMLPSIVRAAWGLVLSLYADSSDVTFGLILSGRSGSSSSTDFDGVAGPTVTTVPFRVSIEMQQTTGQYLDGVKSSGVDILPHQFYDLKRGSNSVDVVAATNFDNILDIVVIGDRFIDDYDPIMIPDQSIKLSQQSSYYLTPLVVLATISKAGDMVLDLTYDSNIIPDGKAEQISAQLELFIRQLVSMPSETLLADLSLLTPREESLVKSWNAHDPQKSAAHHCIHDLVARRTSLRPEASAVEAWDGSMNYGQLDDATSRLAQYLVQLGVTSQSRIPICFDKSLWTVVAMLACLKAGAAYVPLDPSHPTQRLQTIVNFVGGDVMMASDTQIQRFEGVVQHVILLDRVLMASFPPLPTPFKTRVNPEDTAIVVFTSGSTGMPKGVELSHTSFCTLSAEVGGEMDLIKIENLRVLQFAAYAFDVSNAETFLTLINGGTLCIITDEEKQNDLAGAINRLNINWLYLTPTATSLLEPAQVPSLETLILGGEAGNKDIVSKWAHRLHLVNSFGPAEGGIWPSMSHLRPGTSPQNIGRSAGTRLWIVHPDNHEQLVGPIGAVGELLLEGPMLASGYLHEAEKTAAAFLPPPRWAVSLDANGAFYKTGDLCYYNSDGSLSYVGRKDGQIKLRGQRLDLGDVEHAVNESLQQPMAVAADLVHFADRKDPALAVFLCSETLLPASDSPNEELATRFSEITSNLQGKLQLRLPPYMVPSAFIPLRAMPLTMSGKRHRKALKAIASEMAFAELAVKGGKARKPATTATEIHVRRVWAVVLGMNPEDIYASDNFLELGGNSIHVMRVVALLKMVDKDITVAEVFRSKDLCTMAENCRIIEKSPERQNRVLLEPLKAAISKAYPGLIEHLHKRLGIKVDEIEDVLPGGDFQSHCVYFGSLKSRGTANYLSFGFSSGIDTGRIKAAYEAVVARYPMLRTLFTPYEHDLLQVVVKSWAIEIEEFTRVQNCALVRDEWIKRDKAKNSTLGKPVVRGAIISCEDGSAIFIIQQFHARNDAWSDQHFCRDLAAAYEGRDLPSRPSFAQVIRHYQDLSSAKTEHYWCKLLKDSRITPIISHQRPSYDNIVNITLEHTVPGCDTSQIGITTATVLKTAWALVLAEYSQTQDVVFGHLTSGRSQGIASIEEVFGPCLNIVPVRVLLNTQNTSIDLLRSVQEQHVASLDHEWMGERTIIHRCTDWPRMTRFSSVVQYQNINEIREVQMEGGSSWDITLHAVDYDSADVWVLAWPCDDKDDDRKSHSVKVTLCFSEKLINRSLGEAMLSRLCEFMQIISLDKNRQQPVPMSGTAKAQLPLPGPSGTNPSYLPAVGEPMPSQCMLERLQDVVLKAWIPFLNKEGVSKSYANHTKTAYYDLTCSPWMATQLAMEYENVGFPVTVEDIITHPSMEAQAFLLACCVNLDQHKRTSLV